MFFPDEKIIINIQVDNRASERNISSILCTLTHQITIKKGINKELQKINFDLKLLEVQGVEKKKLQERKEFIFDLAQILGDFQKIEGCADKALRSQIIQQLSLKDSYHMKESFQTPPRKRRSSNKYDRQLSKFVEETEKFTFFTTYGLSIKSEFSLHVSIVVTDTIGETTHQKQFPIIIRSPKNGEFINDFDTLGTVRENTTPSGQIIDKYEFLKPFVLPGCNFEARA